MRILIVDDERQITRVLRTSLQSHGYEVDVAQDGSEAMRLFEQNQPDLVVTIIVLSVREQDVNKVLALDSGADDYVTKPFSMPELLARVRVQLRRRVEEASQPASIHEGDFSIDTVAHRVTVQGREVHLTPKEFDLLLLFARNHGRALTHKMLLRSVWGPAGDNQPEYLRVLVAQLRKKIDSPGALSYVESEPWIGYRFRLTL